MRRWFSSITVPLVFTVLLMSATVAFAAPAAWERVDVTLHSQQDESVILVSGELPASVSLPAEAELAVPAGSTIDWIGEILGGAAANDPELKYTKTTVGDSDIYRFTLTKSRIAQVEVSQGAGFVFDGTQYTSTLSWTADSDVPSARLSIRVPKDAQIATGTAGAELLDGDATYGFYSKTFEGVKAGDKVDIAVAYTLTPALAKSTPATATASSGAGPIVPLVIVLLALAGGVALVLAVRRKMKPTSGGNAAKAVSRAPQAASGSTRSKNVASFDDEDEPADSEGDTSQRGLSPAAKRGIVTASIIGLLVVVAFVVAGQNSQSKATGDTITKTFSSAEPCENAQIAVTVDDGADPANTAETLFEAIQSVPSLTTATYNHKTKSIQIGYCESQTSEAALRQALAPTGLVSAEGSAP